MSAPTSLRPIAIWLMICAGMVFGMVILGGLTRLTHSGLSMVEWQPHNFLPPLTQAEWEATFAKYQAFPEFREINSDMTVEGFKSIFWLEYIHRLWGRTIGIVFLLPFLWFAAKRAIPKSLMPKLGLMFVLGGAQGALGWFMVKSGLVDRPDVSQYRLTAHLMMAFLIYGFMIWVAFSLLRPKPAPLAPGLQKAALAFLVLATCTITMGGFVAGLDAGLTYNTFPLMDGAWIPEGLLSHSPWWINAFENIPTVQFLHRSFAEVTALFGLFLWWYGIRNATEALVRRAFHFLGLMVLVQFGLGVTTLLLVVPVSIASIHQAGALVLFTLALNALHRTRQTAA